MAVDNAEKKIGCIVAEDFHELNTIYTSILDHEPDISVLASVYSGQALIQALTIHHPDVILMDIEMESPTAGIEYCRLISTLYPDIHVVVLTCHDEEERILTAFEAGAIDYLLKTDSMSEIITAIRKAYNCVSPIHSCAAETLRKKIQEMGRYHKAFQEFTLAFMTLTPAEKSVLKRLLKGQKQREIAEQKCIELVTVKSHVSRILKKFNLHRTRDILKTIHALNLEGFVEQADTGP
jgi:DNA-binding NarL/FixJ family response regulator